MLLTQIENKQKRGERWESDILDFLVPVLCLFLCVGQQGEK